jgi:hypothetical protein
MTTVALPPYKLSGNAVDQLWPGTSPVIHWAITHPNPLALRFNSLTAAITRLSAPWATPALPCSPSDFAIQQYSGPYPVVIPPSSTRSLQQLGIPSPDWPRIAIIDLPTDQDGCQGASLTLTYDARATLG